MHSRARSREERRGEGRVGGSPVLRPTYFALYERALDHGDARPRAVRTARHAVYRTECWIMEGGHAVMFDHGVLTATECVSTRGPMSSGQGLVSRHIVPAEKNVGHEFRSHGVRYSGAIQSELLSVTEFAETLEEMRVLAKENHALAMPWRDDAGECLSMVDTQRLADVVHIQAFHLLAGPRQVLRSATMFEVTV